MINSQIIQMIMQMLQRQQGSNLFGQNPLSNQFQNQWGPQGRPQGMGWNRFWPTQPTQSNYPAPTTTNASAAPPGLSGIKLALWNLRNGAPLGQNTVQPEQAPPQQDVSRILALLGKK